MWNKRDSLSVEIRENTPPINDDDVTYLIEYLYKYLIEY